MIIAHAVASHYLRHTFPHHTRFPSSLSLYLLRRKKEKGGKKAGGEALESLEAQLRGRAAKLGFSLEQKTKAMKQRDKKVTCTAQNMVLLPEVFHFWNLFLTLMLYTHSAHKRVVQSIIILTTTPFYCYIVCLLLFYYCPYTTTIHLKCNS